MKKVTILLVLWVLGFAGFAQILIPTSWESETALSDQSRQTLEKLRLNQSFSDVRVANFGNLAGGITSNELDLAVPGKKKVRVRARTNKFEFSSDDHFNYVGDTDDGYVVLGKKNGEIFGQINTKDRVIGINHLEGNKVALFDYDMAKLRGGLCAIPPHAASNSSSGRLGDVSANPQRTLPGGPAEHLVDPVVRVLVLYTPAAAATGLNITGTVNTALQQYSTARLNSNVTTQMHLAGIVQLNLIEDESGADASERANNTVQQLAQDATAQNLRNAYEADVVMLLTNGNFIDTYDIVLGIAADFGPSEALAYAVVQITAATSNHTFIHEFAHLFGCRHHNDYTGPYPDSKAHSWYLGWGFWINHYSTLLYSPPNGTTTLNYSNPDTYSHGKRTGVYGQRNNARIISENGWVLQDFRISNPQVPMSVAISGPDYAAVDEQLNFGAQINNPGVEPYSYNWSSTAGPPGTGPSYFVIMPEVSSITVNLTVTDANTQMAYASKNVYWNGLYNLLKDEQPIKRMPEDSDIQSPLIYPNPANSEIIVSVPNGQANQAQIIVTDANGRVVRQVVLELGNNDRLRESVDVSELPSGTYLVTLVAGQTRTTQRFIKKR